VSKVVPTADRAKATVLTKIRFENRDAKVLPEMSAKVHFLPLNSTASRDTVAKIAVSSSAIVRDGSSALAYVVRENVATAVPVELGVTLGSMIEVRKGLEVGEKVVLRPPPSLSSGTRVKLKD
jgi:multidrug efflux pump subunit AcrA (membrane-fusion protein)